MYTANKKYNKNRMSNVTSCFRQRYLIETLPRVHKQSVVNKKQLAGLFFLIKRRTNRIALGTTFAQYNRGREQERDSGGVAQTGVILDPEEAKAAWGFRFQPHTRCHG